MCIRSVVRITIDICSYHSRRTYFILVCRFFQIVAYAYIANSCELLQAYNVPVGGVLVYIIMLYLNPLGR